MADIGMPAGPLMDEVLYERVIHDKPWMWALVNSEFQPTPPPRFSTDPWAWWLLVHRMMVDEWAFEFHTPGALLPGEENPLPNFHVHLTRRVGGDLEEGKAYGETLWEATGRAVLDAVRPK